LLLAADLAPVWWTHSPDNAAVHTLEPLDGGKMSARLQTYEGDGITVTFDPNICIHSGVCVRGLRPVFDVSRKRWVDITAASADEIAAQIENCPSGALQYSRPGTTSR
jgi:uncharacterized Fe-S cluster protein YjdI